MTTGPGGDLLALAPLLVIVAVAGGVLWWLWRHRRALRDGVVRLAERDGLTPTVQPVGMTADDLADRSGATPRGARRYGIEHGVAGPARADLAEDGVEVDLAAFQWWYEERVHDQQHTRYRRRTCTVAVARLPLQLPGAVRIRPEGVLGRLGLRRAGDQLESDRFNRRFRVEGNDQTLTVQLLDARLQEHLLEQHPTRTLDIAGDLVVLGGSPSHRDATLPGVVGELPAVRQDLLGLLRRCPPAFWRAARPVAHPLDRGDDAAPPDQGGGR